MSWRAGNRQRALAALGITALVMAACTGAGDSPQAGTSSTAPPASSPAATAAVDQLPPVSDVLEPASPNTTAPPSSTTSVPADTGLDAVTIHSTDWLDQEPIEVADDPYGFRELLPRLPQQPEGRWRITAPRFTLAFPRAVGDVITYASATPQNVQAVEARSKLTGELIWTQQIEDHRVGGTNEVDGVLVVEWVKPPNGKLHVGLEPSTGEELWRIDSEESSGLLSMYPRFIASADALDSPFFTALDPRTLEPFGTLTPGFLGHRGPLRIDGTALTELDPLTLAPLGDPIDIGLDLANLEGLTTTSGSVVAYDEGELIAFDLTGVEFGRLPLPGNEGPQLIAVGGGSDIVILSYYGYAAALDMTTGIPVWEDEVVLQRFGSIDDEIFATSAWSGPAQPGSASRPTTKLISLATGEIRCSIDGGARTTRHGLYINNASFDLDCRPMWTLDFDQDAEQDLLDEGVLRWKRIGDDIELLFFADPPDSSQT